MSTQEILNTILVIGLLIVVGCIVLLTYYFIKALRSITSLADSLEDTTQNIRESIQMKALAIIPPLLVGIISRIFKKRG